MNYDTTIAFLAGMIVWMIVDWFIRWYEERHPHDRR